VTVNWKAWAAAVAAWAVVGSAVAQQEPKPARIDRNGVIILIRETLIALDQANKTGNYTVLRDLGAPAFQANSARGLAKYSPPSGATISISRGWRCSSRSSRSCRRSKPMGSCT
jgi:hypothetical protein